MQADQYAKGLATIRAEIDAALQLHGLSAAVDLKENSAQRSATFQITANGNSQQDTFSYDEIEDSGEAIDAPAAHRIRTLVSHFVR